MQMPPAARQVVFLFTNPLKKTSSGKKLLSIIKNSVYRLKIVCLRKNLTYDKFRIG